MRKLRHSAGEPMRVLAMACGPDVTVDMIHRLETGRTPARMDLLRAIAEHYGVSVSYLVEEL